LQIKASKINGQESKMHREFVNPVWCNVTYSGGYQARKEIH